MSAAYTGLAQFGRAPGLGPGGREFDSRIRYYSLIAQSVERSAVNRNVAGSSPAGRVLAPWSNG